ncbi:DsbA family oxidoreductase [Pseudomonas sp. JM0905a]|uniref:DsbA family oxidoreductase n=1 Tax=Pseudomonas sp. JM0905a TaxID=2772484 RepID=UPI001684786B|nr:DsbA family oxidoreductase [Pseudomonas sp. JM0905a]MBD2839870.1 DsbA family oxidoreductase [Pseudomonas sp. JM0905a]
MSEPIRIDFISDPVCPWCAIALEALEQALARLPAELDIELAFQPFELNPGMPAAGQDAVEHIMQKYGRSATDIARSQENITTRGLDIGFHFDLKKRTHFYNTFDAHRLMRWAETRGRQRPLAHLLFRAYFTDGRNISDRETLASLADDAGLARDEALEILSSGQFSREVQEREHHYTSRGVHAVPAVILNGRHLISGAQPADYYERALRQVAAEH